MKQPTHHRLPFTRERITALRIVARHTVNPQRHALVAEALRAVELPGPTPCILVNEENAGKVSDLAEVVATVLQANRVGRHFFLTYQQADLLRALLDDLYAAARIGATHKVTA